MEKTNGCALLADGPVLLYLCSVLAGRGRPALHCDRCSARIMHGLAALSSAPEHVSTGMKDVVGSNVAELGQLFRASEVIPTHF